MVEAVGLSLRSGVDGWLFIDPRTFVGCAVRSMDYRKRTLIQIGL